MTTEATETIDWNNPPNYCPRCGSKNLTHDVQDMVPKEQHVFEPQSENYLVEYQCMDCGGASFWM